MVRNSKWLVLAMCLAAVGAVVLPRPPAPREELVTSSELPKQIPPPPQPPAHSSTPQYHVDDQPVGLKLLWVTRHHNNVARGASSTVYSKRKPYAHRTDLMPNMV
ncbi:uncharacterized protein [Anabrus simplex]|uniref:uncharacterized protein n=1 Tax=Anabrus simplex TaxID=316456 RepID=UPI0035A3B729